MMAEPEYIQPSLFELAPSLPPDEVEDESVRLLPNEELEAGADSEPLEVLLDEDSLATALAILEVAESVMDLELLDGLSDQQKRQVWEATPAALRAKVTQLRHTPAQLVPPLQLQQDLPKSGDWVVLNAKPRLTTAELLAIFEVIEVQGDWVLVKAEGLGTRRYLIDWVVIYLRKRTME